MKTSRLARTIAIVTLGCSVMGCSTAPTDPVDRNQLNVTVQDTLQRMYALDPNLEGFLYSARGYVVFPAVGKGGLVAGGAYGRGEVFEDGAFVGYADITQATIGAQAGGQRFCEIIAFQTPDALERFERGELTYTANASVVAVKIGQAGAAQYDNGVVLFVEPVAGLMVEAAIGGQAFTFQAAARP